MFHYKIYSAKNFFSFIESTPDLKRELTWQDAFLQPLELVLGQDEPDQSGHVDERSGLNVDDQVAGQVHAQQPGLGFEG